MTRKLLLENDHIEGIRSYDVYRKNGGYRSVEKALKQMSPDDIVEEIWTSR
jgi:NADH-quinone oxidoreductase subunit F